MNDECVLCKWCLYYNSTRFCDAELCIDSEDHPDNKCDCFNRDLYAVITDDIAKSG